MNRILIDENSSESIEIDLNYIVNNCPSTEIVKEFFAENCSNIISKEHLEFEILLNEQKQ